MSFEGNKNRSVDSREHNMGQKDKLNKYGALRNQTIDHGDEDPPPTYAESAAWSTPKTIAIVGFIIIQVVLISSILHQLVTEKLIVNITPEQIHLSLGNTDNEYHVSWATNQPADCQLVWKRNGSSISVSSPGRMTEAIFEEGSEDTNEKFRNKITNSEKTFKKYFYNAKMTVTPGADYFYYVTSNKIPDKDTTQKEVKYLSERYHFRAIPYQADTNRTLNIIFYGDLGLKNGQSIPRLTQEAMSETNDLIIHNGDFAYDLDTDRGKCGDDFMKLMEPVAARLPYQTSVGNHEIARNFSHYDRRFKMINSGPIGKGQTNNFFYSYNAGPVHFVAISTEFYYFLDYVGLAPLVAQYEWLKADLKRASSAEERAKRPWIIIYGHRPMYCSSRDNDDCSKDSNLLRRGLPFVGGFALEKLFYDFGVDVELYSHEHQYERFLPLYDGKIYAGKDKPENPYYNPLGPVHLISGSAGNQENLDPFKGQPVTGSVRQIADYGFTKITATRCKLYFEQVSDNQAGTIADEFVITKTRQNFPPDFTEVVYKDC